MKAPLLLSLFLTGQIALPAQNADTARIARTLPHNILLAPLEYLSSDRLRGRHIAFREIDTAAKYIADQFRKAGAKPVPGANGYYQPFLLFLNRMTSYIRHEQVGTNIPWDMAESQGIKVKNILAFVEGTDSLLKKQYILLSAHYDHIGEANTATVIDGKRDSIFNGAMDNATGTAAVIDAARYFARYPPKRSVLFICFTAEEEGEFGSLYYARHPLVPLDHTVYNLNVDNAAYNTTTAICLFGLGRTSEDSVIREACNPYGLRVRPEPDGQGLFERSDNFSLAVKGVPAPCFSMGIIKWDDDIDRRYHSLIDEFANIDQDYVDNFIRAYILAAQYIANDPVQPRWTKGDPYEKDWQRLFGKSSSAQ